MQNGSCRTPLNLKLFQWGLGVSMHPSACHLKVSSQQISLVKRPTEC